ncbi:sensor histidine kinase [Neobacillus niacini]|uniref:sensor histidine kinase n=1 Tax=Neobacillus niacini TaxID=86668 RepID=UPI00300054CC
MLKFKRIFHAVRIFIEQNVWLKVKGSIRYKLMVLMLSAMILPLLILIVFSINVSQRNYEKEVVTSNESRIILAGKYIDEKLNESDKLLFSSLLDDKLIPSISQSNEGDIPLDYNTLEYIQDKLYSTYYRNDYIDSISIYAKETQKVYMLKEDEFHLLNLSTIDGTNWDELKVSPHYVFKSGLPQENYSLTRSIIRFEDREIVGGISFDINWNTIDSVIEMLKTEQESSVYLLNKEGQIIYNPNPNADDKITLDMQQILQQIDTSKNVNYLKTESSYVFFKKAFNSQVTIIKVIPMAIIMEGVTMTFVYGIMISIISIIITVLLSIYMSVKTTKPIIQLVDAMKEVSENNFEVHIRTDRNDEIGLLEKNFTTMVYRIKELIEKEYKSEIATKEAQFKALQAQINPHFLYNTLQLVGGMAVARNTTTIYSIIGALSDMFRYITGKQGDLVDIAHEIEHIKNYLFIQEQRFEGRVVTDIFVEEGTENYIIPMLMIQPIVENAFIHGFEQKTGIWKLSIEVQKVFEDLEIIISDNGIGIPVERLTVLQQQINHISNPLNTKGSIGILNVAARIEFYFGEDSDFEISSEVGKGTQVIIRFPAMLREATA